MSKLMNIGPATGKGPNYGLKGLMRADSTPDWSKIEQYDWVEPMKNCPQDAIHHAEGDVWTHTRMVVNELLQLADYQQFTPSERYILFLSALLHDVAKPPCTIMVDGRIQSPKHAAIGEKAAREILWQADFEARETVASLVRLHGLPIWSLDKQNPHRAVIASSLRLSNHHLYLLAKADALGRICDTKEELLLRIELFKEFCLENDCFFEKKAFENNHSRFKFFQNEEASYPSPIYDDTQFEVVIMSGIAGSGKDSFVEKNYKGYPSVSLDDIRTEFKIKPTDKDAQGKVQQIAYERAKDFCRKKKVLFGIVPI